MHRSRSQLYHGNLRRYRILSTNRTIQYTFIAAPRHVWIIPPQPLTTELSSFGVRTIDVVEDDDIFIPGYEYHYLDESEEPPVFYSQIPKGFDGKGRPARATTQKPTPHPGSRSSPSFASSGGRSSSSAAEKRRRDFLSARPAGFLPARRQTCLNRVDRRWALNDSLHEETRHGRRTRP